MRKLIKNIGVVICLAMCAMSAMSANAYEVKNVCASYQTNYSWSNPYQVQAQIYSGQELNRAVGSYSRYDYISHYAVIFWSNGQASVIKLTDPYVSGMMLFQTRGFDQQGRQWRLSDNNYGMCI